MLYILYNLAHYKSRWAANDNFTKVYWDNRILQTCIACIIGTIPIYKCRQIPCYIIIFDK